MTPSWPELQRQFVKLAPSADTLAFPLAEPCIAVIDSRIRA
jgi:hypothetical protein